MRLVPGVFTAVLLMWPAASLAQAPARPADESRIFVDVNLIGSVSTLAHERQYKAQFVQFGEVASMGASYPKPSGASGPLVDVGGGFMLNHRLGVGVGYSRTTYQDVVGLTATIPHPIFLNSAASDNGATDTALARIEAATNIFLVYLPLRTGRSQLRLYGGPSIFTYREDMVTEVLYTQTFSQTTPANSITVTGFSSEKVKGNGAGFHAGLDYAYFFTNVFGVVGGARYSYGTITVDQEPLSQLSQDIRVGNILVFAGVRVRFGR